MKIARIAKSQLIVKSYIMACLLTLFSALTAWGQSGKLFNTDNKLSSNLVTQVYQDTNGFIWITTRNGINVYDGYNFTVFKKNADDKTGLNTTTSTASTKTEGATSCWAPTRDCSASTGSTSPTSSCPRLKQTCRYLRDTYI